MSISRHTFDPDKHYKQVLFHQDRDLLDSELNELQAIQTHERTQLGNAIYNEGAILDGLEVIVAGANLQIASGKLYLDGCVVGVAGTQLNFDPAKSEGVDYVFASRLIEQIGRNQDPGLINPATGEATAERQKWKVTLHANDPGHTTNRKTLPIYKFDRETGTVTPIVVQKSNLALGDLAGNLPCNRISVASITEDQLNFEAAEGLHSLLQNLAERTFDQAGSYLVSGLDSFVGQVEDDHVWVVTNAGRAYVQGFRLHRDLPTRTLVPKSTATRFVRGEQKTFLSGQRRYLLNSSPLQASSQVEAIVETVANITRGSVGGGEDLLTPNPVVHILEVSQGGTVFQKDVDWTQSGNMVDWLAGGQEPGIGTTYTVRWTYTKQLVKDVDYTDGGWFGVPNHPPAGAYYYLVSSITPLGESGFDLTLLAGRTTEAGNINTLSWSPVIGATAYRIYRAGSGIRDHFRFLDEVDSNTTNYIDDGVVALDMERGAPANSPPAPESPRVSITPANTSLINFGRAGVGVEPVPGSNCSIDYEYYLGRRDIIYATAHHIKRLEGPPADEPKMPVAPEQTLALCSIYCPPDATNMVIENFGLARITMDQIHKIIRDVEDLKYNDALSQMTTDLQNRDAQTKKGIYSDDFSNTAQSDVYHPDWNARIDGLLRFVSPNRIATANLLTVDQAGSDVLFTGSLALLPGEEQVLIEQTDWSEEKNINPYAVFEKPEAVVDVTPNIGRRGQTGIAVRAANLTPGMAGITVWCDGQEVASGLVSDQIGRVTAAFTIPDTVQNGDRVVEISDGIFRARTNLQVNDPLVVTCIERIVNNRTIIRNRTIVVHHTTVVNQPGGSGGGSGGSGGSGSGGSSQPIEPNDITDLVRPPIRIIRKPVANKIWQEKIRPAKRDPLAQTFSFPVSRIVSKVGVFFTQKDAALPVTIQIRGVTTGLPNHLVLAETVLAPNEVSLTGETQVSFDDPFYAQANTSYAVVLLTNSTQYRVRVASLGQMGQNGIITGQTYTAGVLLESSNAETWTPLNGSDLNLRIYGYAFQPEGEIRFMPLTGVQFSELNLDEYSAIPEGSGIAWEYSLDGGVTWDAMVPAEEENLPGVATQIRVRARFFGSQSNESPALKIGDVNLLGYLNQEQGIYVSRENELVQTVTATKLYVQMDIPSGTSITWTASNDGGQTWEATTLEATRPIDEEWTEYTLTCVFADPSGRNVRYKAEMTGTHLVYPRIHSLGATLS